MERYIGHGYTNNKGIAKLEYDETGTQLTNTGVQGYGKGKVDLKAKMHKDSTTQSEPFGVWDTLWHDENSYTDTLPTLNIPIDSNSFAFEFDTVPTESVSQTWFNIGTSWNNRIIVGLIYRNTSQGIRVMKNGTDVAHSYASTSAPLGETAHIKFTYDNGVMTYSDGDETVTLTNTDVTPSTLLSGALVSSTVSNMKIYNI